jgi:quinol monooxygenase YgiN
MLTSVIPPCRRQAGREIGGGRAAGSARRCLTGRMAFYVRARFAVREGQAPEFGRVVRALTEAAAQEPGTQSFLWFSGQEPGSYVAIKRYADPTSFRRHCESSSALRSRLTASAELIQLEIYGDIDEELGAWVETQPQAAVYPSAVFET